MILTQAKTKSAKIHISTIPPIPSTSKPWTVPSFINNKSEGLIIPMPHPNIAAAIDPIVVAAIMWWPLIAKVIVIAAGISINNPFGFIYWETKS